MQLVTQLAKHARAAQQVSCPSPPQGVGWLACALACACTAHCPTAPVGQPQVPWPVVVLQTRGSWQLVFWELPQHTLP